MSVVGRKPLWERVTPEHMAQALLWIQEGIPKVTAFVALGYSRTALHRAQQMGKEAEAKEEDGEILTEKERGALAFWRLLETAFGKAEIEVMRAIIKAGMGAEDLQGKTGRQWQALKWLLECTRPEYRQAEVITPAPQEQASDADREADLRAFAAARGLRLVADKGTDDYDPETALKTRT
jgi:hypothetical protein